MLHQVFNSIGSHIYNGIVYENFEFWAPNFHNSFEFYYIMEGNMTANVNASVIELNEGDCFLIAPNMPHSLHKHGNNKFFVGVFSADFIPSFANNEMHTPFIRFQISGVTLAYLKEKMFHTITPDMFELKSCLYAICDCVAKHEDNDSNAPPINTDFVIKTNDYIAKNLCYSFTRREIADFLNYEEHYFSNLFTLNFRVNFKTYVNTLRLAKACNLLKESDMTITDIAYKCGFNGIRNFNTLFKNYMGKTPSQYRNDIDKIHVPDVLDPYSDMVLEDLKRKKKYNR